MDFWMDALISADDCPGQISHYGTHQISNVLQISQNLPISHNQRHQISKVYQILQKEPNVEVSRMLNRTNKRISNWNWRSCLCHVMFISSLTIHLFITFSLHVVIWGIEAILWRKNLFGWQIRGIYGVVFEVRQNKQF